MSLQFRISLGLVAFLLLLPGCKPDTLPDGSPAIGKLEKVWGEQGVGVGHIQKPRAMAIDSKDLLYLVDMTARIQVFDLGGNYIRGWQTPVHENGRPTGISIGRDGNVLVADTHYYRVLIYSPTGELLRQIGGENGPGPEQFGWVTDIAEDHEGNYFISEYGEFDRIHVYTHDGKFIRQWGTHGEEPGQFSRPQSIALDDKENLWVADSCNHRIQVFDRHGTLLKLWGEQGAEPGKLSYPYGLVLDGKGHVLICEYGNNRIQEFTLEGKSIGCWGSEGRKPGELFNPWSLVLDSGGKMHVLDSNNHRVQTVLLR